MNSEIESAKVMVKDLENELMKIMSDIGDARVSSHISLIYKILNKL